MKHVFADTGYWIGLLNPSDELHSVCLKALHSVRGQTIVTSEWVLVELLNHFAPRGARMRASTVEAVTSLRRNVSVTVIPQNTASFIESFDSYRVRPDKDWSLTDCSSFLIMRQYGIDSALTHDRHFEQAGFRALLR